MTLNKKKLKSKKYNILCTKQIRVFLELKTNLVFFFFFVHLKLCRDYLKIISYIHQDLFVLNKNLETLKIWY